MMPQTKITKRLSALLLAAALLPPVFSPAARAEADTRLSGYTGEGTVLAIVAAGFDVTHEVFSVRPESPTLREAVVNITVGVHYKDAYLSEKIPFAWDYVGTGLETEGFRGDAILTGLSDAGTELAALAAGHYIGKGEAVNEDGTVTLDEDYLGAAPDAQLLLMKAATDHSSKLQPKAVAAAIRHAVALGADGILLDLTDVTPDEALYSAFRLANNENIPIFTGAGDVPLSTAEALATVSAALTERSTLTEAAAYPGVYAIGAAADPYGSIDAFYWGESEIEYNDSSAEYLGKSFAEILTGKTLTLLPVPGEGRAEDYAGLPMKGAVALVRRGGISFAEKAEHAAAAGAVAMIVVNTEPGTTRMALSGTTIPAVMVTPENGLVLSLTAGTNSLTVPQAYDAPAAFTAEGPTADFSALPLFVVRGENCKVAVRGDAYALRSGTKYAAAGAVGYLARAVEYLRDQGFFTEYAKDVLVTAAQPLLGEDGLPAAARVAGAGLLSEAGRFSTVFAGRAQPSATAGHTLTVPVTLVNPGAEAVTLTVTAAFTTKEIGEDGKYTGKTVSVSNGTATLTKNGANLGAGEAEVITLAAQSMTRYTLTLSFSEETLAAWRENAPYGFYLDGGLTLTPFDGTFGTTVPLAAFFGDKEDAPLVDVSVYDGGEAYLATATLSVYSAREGFSMPLGQADPFTGGDAYDEMYNIVSPTAVADGEVRLHVTPLRKIERITVRFYDGAGNLLYEDVRDGAERYLVTGKAHTVSLWDFVADDGSGYLFPDGKYLCEVTFASGAALQTLAFSLTADSARPTLSDVQFAPALLGGAHLTVTATDGTALREVKVYDLTREYRCLTAAPVAGETAATLTFDLTFCPFDSPVYIEVTDYAGQYTVARYEAGTILDILAGVRT